MRNLIKVNRKLIHSTFIVQKSDRNIHNCFKYILFVAQCFGLVPVRGVLGKDIRGLKFTWKSVRVLFSIVSCISTGFIAVMNVRHIIVHGNNVVKCGRVMFYGSSMAFIASLITLARKWPALMGEWSRVELHMYTYGWPPNLKRKLSTLAASILTIGTVEHIMIEVSNVRFAQRCKRQGQSTAEFYFGHAFPSIFPTFEYDWWKGFLIQIVNSIDTFSWTFGDVLIMLFSIALSVRFKQITQRVDKYLKEKAKSANESAWAMVREDFNQLSVLTKNLNEAISSLILISFSNNLFFILLQLFHSLTKRMDDTSEKIYFYFSFGFLLLRTILVCLYGAAVNEESIKPLVLLHSAPSYVYNQEIRRFIDQLNYDTIALSGKNFFNVTRNLILSIAGAIVTYELVLIQFYANLMNNEAAPTPANVSKCYHT